MIEQILHPFAPNLHHAFIESWCGKHKLQHLKDIRQSMDPEPKRSQTLLIDDDPQNSYTAYQHGYLVLPVYPRQGLTWESQNKISRKKTKTVNSIESKKQASTSSPQVKTAPFNLKGCPGPPYIVDQSKTKKKRSKNGVQDGIIERVLDG